MVIAERRIKGETRSAQEREVTVWIKYLLWFQPSCPRSSAHRRSDDRGQLPGSFVHSVLHSDPGRLVCWRIGALPFTPMIRIPARQSSLVPLYGDTNNVCFDSLYTVSTSKVGAHAQIRRILSAAQLPSSPPFLNHWWTWFNDLSLCFIWTRCINTRSTGHWEVSTSSCRVVPKSRSVL